MRFTTNLLSFSIISIICFTSNLSQAAPIDSTNTSIRPTTSPMTLCAQLYVNDVQIGAIDVQNTLQGFTDPANANCKYVFGTPPIQYELYTTTVFVPVISARYVEFSWMTCPADYPVPQAIQLYADTGPSSVNLSLRAFCCKAGFTMSVKMVWQSGTTCSP